MPLRHITLLTPYSFSMKRVAYAADKICCCRHAMPFHATFHAAPSANGTPYRHHHTARCRRCRHHDATLIAAAAAALLPLPAYASAAFSLLIFAIATAATAISHTLRRYAATHGRHYAAVIFLLAFMMPPLLYFRFFAAVITIMLRCLHVSIIAATLI